MSSIKSEFDSKIEADMLAADPEQKEMMKEECIVVTNDDVPIGPGSKKECKLDLRSKNCQFKTHSTTSVTCTLQLSFQTRRRSRHG